MRTPFTFLVLGVASLGLLVAAPPKAEAQFRNPRMFVSRPAAPVRAAMMPAFMPNRALFPNHTPFRNHGLFPNHALFPNHTPFRNHGLFPNRVFRHRDFDHDRHHFSQWWSSPFYATGLGYGYSAGMTYAYSGGIPYGYSPLSYGGAGYSPMSYGSYGSYQPAYAGENSYTPYAATAPAEEEGVVDVGIYDNYFRPTRVTVSVGTTVRWTNGGHDGHAVTSDDDRWDSGEMGFGGSYGRTFSKPGTYRYHCKFHPDEMRGEVIVK
jgi:plastocyanin